MKRKNLRIFTKAILSPCVGKETLSGYHSTLGLRAHTATHTGEHGAKAQREECKGAKPLRVYILTALIW